MFTAITREISPAMQQCELTYLSRTRIDIDLARRQHHAYMQALVELGGQVTNLPAEAELPDSVFVEDAAIVLDELAVITRPGAVSRRPETTTIAEVLRPYRKLAFITAQGTLEGGDVLRVDKKIFVGLSGRSNQAGIDQLAAAASPYGYQVVGVTLQDCLHLKSAVSQVGVDTLLINRAWVNPETFPGMKLIDVHPEEPNGANALYTIKGVIYPASCAKTRQRLEEQGIRVITVDMSEVEKAEGAVTCCSLIFNS